MIKIDARGLNCPKPVILAKKQLDEIEKGEVEITVDNKVAVENLSRLANGQNYQYSVVTLSETEYIVTIDKSVPKNNSCEIIDEEILNISISSSTMGGGDEELGKILMKSFIYTVSETKPLPKTILFYNSGVFLTCEDSPVIDDLIKLNEMGVEIHTCGTCLDFYNIKDKFKVGIISNMYTIYENMKEATKNVSIG